ncbi:protease modulator HflC [Roseisalinus antarcticus]|uniref:Modulator of FtsH protease HflC n=1 Tax=Roseisalinus antarcticus TaxID=254357 RepID=A0A1Y5TYQ5_9RHOB|nr:protease modulator HflC [Roseisalinus antarcticus]SLN76058.1 Modulator of FtsH protease HflC [Roseisalinus antarcticus]
MRRTAYLLPILAIIIAGLMSSVIIVDERQKVLVLQFGRVVSVKEDPGLAFKIPLIQEVVRYDDRTLSLDVDPLEVTPLDDRRLVVDAFARYRIIDVNQFRQAVGAGAEEAAAQRLDGVLRDEVRAVLGQVTSNDILSTDRAGLMLQILEGAQNDARTLGLTLIDVRLKRTDLPPSNLNATFERMIAEREREAADEVARGNEAAQRTRATADRTVIELVSDAERQAEITRGEADALRSRIYANAFGADPEFYDFYRSMTAYARALQSGNTRMVLSPDSDFFTYLRSDNPLGIDLSAAARDALAGSEASMAEDAAGTQSGEGASDAETETQTETEADTTPAEDGAAPDAITETEG